ncbi:MAG: dockerin type I repeat-containing protein [Clostridiales bacterium]|nr:dockerin type I repeat-containing protein [Clostridiales bacterium]
MKITEVKKFLAALLAVTMMMATIAVPAFASELTAANVASADEATADEATADEATADEATPDEPVLVYGDVDLDGVVTVADVTLVQKASALLVTLTDEQTVLADVNGDGRVSVLDATCIQKCYRRIFRHRLNRNSLRRLIDVLSSKLTTEQVLACSAVFCVFHFLFGAVPLTQFCAAVIAA